MLVILAAIAAYGMRFSFDDLYLPQDYSALVLFAVFCVVLIFPRFNLYGLWRGKSLATGWRNHFGLVYSCFADDCYPVWSESVF